MAWSDVPRTSGSTLLPFYPSPPLFTRWVYCSVFFVLLCLDGLNAASSFSQFLCLFEAAAASISGQDLSEPGSGLSLTAVFGTSVSFLGFIMWLCCHSVLSEWITGLVYNVIFSFKSSIFKKKNTGKIKRFWIFFISLLNLFQILALGINFV